MKEKDFIKRLKNLKKEREENSELSGWNDNDKRNLLIRRIYK